MFPAKGEGQAATRVKVRILSGLGQSLGAGDAGVLNAGAGGPVAGTAVCLWVVSWPLSLALGGIFWSEQSLNTCGVPSMPAPGILSAYVSHHGFSVYSPFCKG